MPFKLFCRAPRTSITSPETTFNGAAFFRETDFFLVAGDFFFLAAGGIFGEACVRVCSYVIPRRTAEFQRWFFGFFPETESLIPRARQFSQGNELVSILVEIVGM